MALDAWSEAKREECNDALQARTKRETKRAAADKKAARAARNEAKKAAESLHAVVKKSRQLSSEAFEDTNFKNAQTRQHIYLSEIECEILAKWGEKSAKPWSQTIQ